MESAISLSFMDRGARMRAVVWSYSQVSLLQERSQTGSVMMVFVFVCFGDSRIDGNWYEDKVWD